EIRMGTRPTDDDLIIDLVHAHDRSDKKPVNMVKIIERQVEKAQKDYESADITTDLPDEANVKTYDEIEFVVDNLIENAIEHNDTDNPEVRVEVLDGDTLGDNVEIRFIDNGPGIPEEEKEVLTEEKETPLKHGSGIGLWLVNHLVRKSDGELEFSENQPRGSTVAVKFEEA
ncbi:MAG: ATP-binding protein, partial [Halobacteria archaeon]|nr:ATP-binding protein [Halobacteria archaeon]